MPRVKRGTKARKRHKKILKLAKGNVGGKPSRSRYSRRASVVLSACGEGISCSFSSRAKTKLSIGVLTQALSFTAGKAGRTGATNAQCCGSSEF